MIQTLESMNHECARILRYNILCARNSPQPPEKARFRVMKERKRKKKKGKTLSIIAFRCFPRLANCF
jgi:hypothetical protein